jgi:hypothetical protein
MSEQPFIDPKQWSRRVKMMFRRSAAYRTVFNTPDGQMVLADIFRFCGMDADIQVPGEPHETAYNAGKRRVALRICSLLDFTEREAAALAKQERTLTEETQE